MDVLDMLFELLVMPPHISRYFLKYSIDVCIGRRAKNGALLERTPSYATFLVFQDSMNCI